MAVNGCIEYCTIYDYYISNSNDFYQSIKLIDDVLVKYTNTDNVNSDDKDSSNDISCIFMIISQCFKSTRSSAHPERYIGKAYDTNNTTNECNTNNRAALLHLIMKYMKPLITRINSILSSSSLPSLYFYINLFYDFIEEMNSNNYIAEGYEMIEFFLQSLDCSNISIYCSYAPNSSKLLEIFQALLEESGYYSKLNLEQRVNLAITVSRIMILMMTNNSSVSGCGSINNNNSISSNDCYFIVAHGDMRFSVFNGMIGVYNRLLLLHDNSNNTSNIINTITDISKVITLFIEQEGIIRTVTKLSEDDSDLVEFLNNMAEVMLRLKAHTGDSPSSSSRSSSTSSSSSSSSTSSSTSILIQYYDQLNYLGCDIFCLFIIFIKNIIVSDTTTFVDLLISPETKILKYFLRITKCFERDNGELIAACDHFKNIYNRANNNDNNTDVADKKCGDVIIYDTGKNNIVIDFGLLEFSDNEHDSNSKDMLATTTTTNEVHEDIIIFLKRFVKVSSLPFFNIRCYHYHQEMARMNNSLPFDMSLIKDRLKNIIDG